MNGAHEHEKRRRELAEAIDIAAERAHRDAVNDLMGHARQEEEARMVRDLMERLRRETGMRR